LAVFDSDCGQAAQTAEAFPVFGVLDLEGASQDAGEPVALVFVVLGLQDAADLAPGQERLDEEAV
jgi:hypothetical protein